MIIFLVFFISIFGTFNNWKPDRVISHLEQDILPSFTICFSYTSTIVACFCWILFFFCKFLCRIIASIGKCTYQNPELGQVKVDMAKVGSWTSHVGFERGLCREDKRKDLQNKGLWRSCKYMSELRIWWKGWDETWYL